VYARSTTVQAHPDSINAGIKHIRDEVMLNLLSMPGCIGLSMLVDRQTRRCIVTSAWDSLDAMAASEAQLDPIRNHAAEALGGRPQVDQWEFAVVHRDHTSHPGARVRGTWFRVDPSGFEHAVDVYRMAVLPALAELPGFCSATLLTDRETGLCVSSVTFDDAAAIEATRDPVAGVRRAYTQDTGAEILDVGEFELVLAHLRVPELV
jgi:heme-degrading monooxygenase HmoA